MNIRGIREVNPSLESGRLQIACRIRGMCCHTVAAILIMCMPLPAEEPKTVPESTPSYARTPQDVLPYRNFQEPYHRFFQSVTEFRGAGRDDLWLTPPPTVRIGFIGPLGPAPVQGLRPFVAATVREL